MFISSKRCVWIVCGVLYCSALFQDIVAQDTITQASIASIAAKDDPMPVRRGSKFYNPPCFQANEFSFFHGIKFLCKKLWDKVSGNACYKCNVDDWYAPLDPLTKSIIPTVQWIGHATCLIQLNNFTILTDPVFGDISLIITCARSLPAGIQVKKLPPIDMVLISHNHRDHLDVPSLEALVEQQPLLLVPQGVGELVSSLGFRRVTEYTWWQQQTCAKRSGERLICTFVPASHGSGRGLFDFNTSLWGGWILQAAGNTLYFAGDTAYNDVLFTSIAKHFPSVQIAMLPIGPGNPRELMAKVHLNADDALKVCKQLSPHIFVPIHWGVFKLSSDMFDDELKVLLNENKKASLAANKLQISLLKVGQRVQYAPLPVA